MIFISKMILKMLWRQAFVLAKDEIANGFPISKKLKLQFTTKVLLRSEEVRISFAHLIRIKHLDKYLLVKSNRIDQFQPVGGVYKYNVAEMKRDFSEKGVHTDEKIPIDEDSMGDLRLMVPAHHLDWLVKWFESGTSREVSPAREFNEELVKEKILSESFGSVDFSFEYRVVYPLKWSDHFNCYELLIHDVFTPNLTQRQLDELSIVYKAGDGSLHRWATRKLIHSRGYDESLKGDAYRVGKHTKAIISQNF